MNRSQEVARQEVARKIGKLYGSSNGKRAVESGQLAKAGKLAPVAENGRVQGAKNAETGHIQRIQKMGASPGGRAAAHLVWHVRRNRPNYERCSLCWEELEEKLEHKLSAVNPPAAQPQGSNQQ
jgi:hypothetical protein